MRFFVYCLLLSLPTLGILIFFGLYPIVLVDNSPIFSITWKTANRAAQSFTNTQAKAQPEGKAIDFKSTQNSELLLELRRGTLTFLIEDNIMAHDGRALVKDFDTITQTRAQEGLGQVTNVSIKELYGLSRNEFFQLVLLPQARRDVLGEVFKASNANFQNWLDEAKRQKSIRLFFIPFRWDGEQVR